MAVGEKYAFLQYVNSVKQTIDTAGATITIGATSTGLPVNSVRVQNLSTATAWIGMGTQGTTSASVTSAGVSIQPTNQIGCVQVFRTGGALTVSAFTVGATQTTSILVTGGEGLSA